MRRLATSALAAAVLAAGIGRRSAGTGDMMGRRASAFDLGIYAGGAWTTDWFEISDNGFAPELSSHLRRYGRVLLHAHASACGCTARTCRRSARERGRERRFRATAGSSTAGCTTWTWCSVPGSPARMRRNWMASTYFFLGGGGYTANIAGESRYPGCLQLGRLAGQRRVRERPAHAVDHRPGRGGLRRGHVPHRQRAGAVHRGRGARLRLAGARATRTRRTPRTRFTFTPRLVLGLKAMFGNLIPPPPPPPAADSAAAAGRCLRRRRRRSGGRRATSGCAWWRTARCVTITAVVQHADR